VNITSSDPARPGSGGGVALVEELTPRQIVAELDKFIVGQEKAKRAVAIALRNRYRRRMLPDDLRDEVIPKNILMIGPTGVGKTEIARRLAKLARAPFLKIEATKFTEVGYVGRDVDSMVRDLVQVAVRLVEAEMTEAVRDRADAVALDRIVDILQPRRGAAAPRPGGTPPGASAGLPHQLAEFQQQMGKLLGFPVPAEGAGGAGPTLGGGGAAGNVGPEAAANGGEEYARRRAEQEERIRERLREQVASGARDADEIEIDVEEGGGSPFLQVFSPGGMEEMGMSDLQGMLGQMLPKRRKTRRVTIREARALLAQEAARSLIDQDALTREAVERTEQGGIIFLDELDKIAARGGASGQSGGGPDVSREGVQRDLLPIIEGSTVQTKQGPVRTNHILFIAAGAFHVSKPSDLIPELQGRLPIRVELDSLSEEDFRRILTEPRNALTRQYAALLGTEGVQLDWAEDAAAELARVAVEVNTRTENIGARRLHTILERLLEDLSFEAPDVADKRVTIDAAFVRERLQDVAKDEDLSRYIL
jgi:ATP-dependent HslUV protease ATP-binding subunit HslU